MSFHSSVVRKFPRSLAVSLAAALGIALISAPGPVAAAVTPDAPPSEGCLDFAVASVALTDRAGTVTTSLDTEGPIVEAYIEWGGNWSPAPLDSTLGVGVTGPGGTNSADVSGIETTDATGLPTTPETIAYGYRQDITDLFLTGLPGGYEIDIMPPVDGVNQEENEWWGATVTAVYDSSPCAQETTVLQNSGIDYFFGGNSTSSPTTDTIVYDWGYPLREDYVATFTESLGGVDFETTDCRAVSTWVATGGDSPPEATDDLVDDDGVANPGFGAAEGIVGAATPPNQPCAPAATNAPVLSVQGGAIGPSWGIIQFDVLLPAGSTWAAVQFESPEDNGGPPGLPMAGALLGGVVLVPAFVPPVAGIGLETTILPGADGACPGVEGTDEHVVGEIGSEVTYCFTVTNSGDVPLDSVDIDDPDLEITMSEMTLVSGDDGDSLGPGDRLVYSFESTITGDLLNTATATGRTGGGGAVVADDNDASVEALFLAAVLDSYAEDGVPYLGYELTTNATATDATITFFDDTHSESVVVDTRSGRVLWPGAAVDAEGNATDWPGWDQDTYGNWSFNSDAPDAWAFADLSVTIEINPTYGPVTVAYPTAAAPPAPDPTPTPAPTPAPAEVPQTPSALPATGASPEGALTLGLAVLVLGGGLVLASRLRTRGRS